VDDTPSNAPRNIGRYEIRKELGRGTMGVVYEAYDPALGRTIALKTIELAFAASRETREAFEKRFFAEARISARLTHPGIVVVHDVGRDQESGVLFIALEHLKGRTLAEVVKHAPIEWREALHISARVAEALHHAHSHGVIHRDIKPANIMLLPSGEPKIMDFGIAKIETARIKLTATGQFFGTPLYMSPEQALGRKVDHRTDLFSLGAITYSLLTGRLAFNAENIPKIIGRVLNEDPTPPTQIVRSLPPGVDYLTARALAKAAEDRHPDGTTLAEDIEDVLAGRQPRHRAGWTAPRRAEGTLSFPSLPPESEDAEVDLLLEELAPADSSPLAERPSEGEPELSTLISGPAQPSPVPVAVPPAATTPPAGRSAAARPVTRPVRERRDRDLRPQPTPPSERRRVWALAGLMLALLAAWAFLRPPVPDRERRVASPRPSPQAFPSTAPAERETLVEPLVQATQAPTPVAVPSVRARLAEPASRPAPLPSPRSARLAIDFEHALKTGTIRIWVGDTLVLEEDLEGRVTKKVVGIRIRRGRLENELDVSAGKHVVRVQVAWDDSLKEDSLPGTFEPGSTRRLEIRLGRLRKNVSLEWK